MAKTAQKKQREVLPSARTGRYTATDVTPVIKGIHVSSRGSGKWVVKKVGPKQPSRLFSRKETAIAWAKEMASSPNIVIYVHRPDGSVVKEKVARAKD